MIQWLRLDYRERRQIKGCQRENIYCGISRDPFRFVLIIRGVEKKRLSMQIKIIDEAGNRRKGGDWYFLFKKYSV